MFTETATFAPRRALTAIRRLVEDPEDLPQVFTVIQALSGRTGEHMRDRLRTTDAGRDLLARRPDIVPILVDREALRAMPEGSLAHAYLAFVESEQISAEGIIAASEAGTVENEGQDPEVAYVTQRMRDTHDLWHALSGYHGDVLGELSLLGFLLAQTHNPGVALIVAAGLFKAGGDKAVRSLVLEGFLRGRRAAWLPEVDWAALLPRPVDEVRELLRVGAPPVYTPVRPAELKARFAA